MEQYLSDRNQLHIFDNDNFSIIPKSIFFDKDNLPISCKNADISAVDNFFYNIAHPYMLKQICCRLNMLFLGRKYLCVTLTLSRYNPPSPALFVKSPHLIL